MLWNALWRYGNEGDAGLVFHPLQAGVGGCVHAVREEALMASIFESRWLLVFRWDINENTARTRECLHDREVDNDRLVCFYKEGDVWLECVPGLMPEPICVSCNGEQTALGDCVKEHLCRGFDIAVFDTGEVVARGFDIVVFDTGKVVSSEDWPGDYIGYGLTKFPPRKHTFEIIE